jgi:5-methylthioadenosine/S-adenosylhomocysteine deaminase
MSAERGHQSETIIHGATIVTADEGGSIHHDAALVVQDNRIAAIGPSAELLARHPRAERVDGRGRAVLPGFANTHTHFLMTLARGIYEDLSPPHRPPFTGGLARVPLPELSTGERQVMAQLAALEAIRSGTTLVLEDRVGIDGFAGAPGTARTRRSASRAPSRSTPPSPRPASPASPNVTRG